jgi:hypothetical protein
VKTIVAVARPGPFALAKLDRLPQRLVRRTQREIEHGRRAAVKRSAADLLGRRAQQILVAPRERDRRAAVDVRVDAARDNDLPGGVDDPRSTDRRKASGRRPWRSCPANADIGRLPRRQNHRLPPVTIR